MIEGGFFLLRAETTRIYSEAHQSAHIKVVFSDLLPSQDTSYSYLIVVQASSGLHGISDPCCTFRQGYT
jgi:hypothetical protein